jgi:hypothetical protein
MYKTGSVVVIDVAPDVLSEPLFQNEIRILFFLILLGPFCADHCDNST